MLLTRAPCPILSHLPPQQPAFYQSTTHQWGPRPPETIPMVISLVRVLLGLLSLTRVANGTFTFRTAMVMDASNDVSLGRLRGHAAFLSVLATKYPQGVPLGREIEGVDRPRFNFSIEVTTQLKPGREHEQLEELLSGDDSAHFLFGVESEEGLAKLSGAFAERRNRIMIHCCAEDNAFQGRRWEFFFTMMPTYVDALRPVMDSLFIDDIEKIGVIYDETSSYYKSACEALIEKLGKVEGTRVVFAYAKNSTTRYEDAIPEIVDGVVNNEVAGFIGCTSRTGAESLVNAFWKRKYALKVQAYTQGPMEKAFVQALGERSRGIIGVSLFHPAARYTDDDFFGDPQSFLDTLGTGEDIDHGIPLSAGSFFALSQAIQGAFSDCDISGAEGDVDRLLFGKDTIRCSDRRNSGYKRVQQSLRFLAIRNSIVGPIEFNKFNQNFRSGAATLMTQVQPQNDSQLVVRVVSPALFASHLPDLPVRNPFSPQVCPPGYFQSNDKFDPCMKCPRGSVSSEENAPACSICLQDTYSSSDGKECIPCPDNAFTNSEGSKSIRSCRCEYGFYNTLRLTNTSDKNVGGLNCVKCPTGAQCRGRDALPVPLVGFWADPSFPTEVYECEDETSCPGGFKCGATEDGTPTHEGRLCSSCASGFFSAMEQCVKCMSTLHIVLLLVVLYSIWFFVNNFVATKFDTFEMVLTWVQLANIVGSLDLDWPKRLTVLFSITSFLDFDVDAIEPSCIFSSWGFMSNFSVQLMLPIILSFLAMLRYGLFYLLYVRKMSSILSGQKVTRSISLERLITGIGFRVPARRADEWLREKKDQAIAECLSAVDLTYLTITRYCFEVLKCDTITGISVLRSSPDVECSSGTYGSLRILGACGFVFYTIGYIAFTSYTLIRLHYTRMYPNKSSILRFGYLYERFELGYAWVAIASLIVRIFFVASVVFIEDPKVSVGIMSLVACAWLLIQVHTLPYVNAVLDFLQTCLLVGLLAISFSGLMFSSKPLGSHSRKKLESSELAVVGIMATAAFVILIREISIKIRLKIIQNRHKQAVIKSLPKDVDPSYIEHDIVINGGVEEELYGCLSPDYLYQWLKDADQETLMDFDKLSIMLSPYLSEDSYSSFLSQEIVARFWRKLVDGFPEIIDYLLTVDENSRAHFCQFSTVLYRGFFLRHHAKGARFHHLINWRDRAALAQWLALAKGEDRIFFKNVVLSKFNDYFKHVPKVPVPPGDDHCIEKYVCSEFKDCMQESSDVEVRESFSSRIWKSLSVDCRAAMEELQAGRGPLAHERKGKITCYRTELCQFARQLSQAKNRSCRRRCLTKFLQVHQEEIEP